MRSLLMNIKNKLSRAVAPEEEEEYDIPETVEEYVELNTEGAQSESKIMVRPFNLTDFADVKPVLDALREGFTIALINIRALKERDLVELKRAVNKLKKTCDAMEGDIVGFGDDWIVAAPSYVEVFRDIKARAKPLDEEDFE